ncbi:MAG: cupin domain-containing protein [Alphaproteobacteria bacterium]
MEKPQPTMPGAKPEAANAIGPAEARGKLRHDNVSVESIVNIDDRVGRELKDLRRARDLTLTDLGKLTGLSRGYLSQIERGKSIPSVKALHSISRALNVTISWFFPENDGDDEPDLSDIVVRAGNRRQLSFERGVTDQLLSPSLGGSIELLRCVFEPHSGSGSQPYTHQGEETGIVLSGTLHLWVGDRHIVLNEGDSFAFPSTEPHRYTNPTDQEAVVIWAISPPSY